MATEQQLANRRLWIDALRSGEYKQGKGALQNGDRFCCLGVACAVLGIPKTISDYGAINYGNSGERSSVELPDSAAALLGMHHRTGANYESSSLSDRNDDGDTFAEIAYFIEGNPDGLWNDE